MSRLIKINKYFQPLIKNGNNFSKLLDVGCSNGAFVQAALDLHWDAYGCDVSISAVPASLSDRVRLGDITSCGWHRRTFDIVALNDVLEHLIDPIPALKVAKGLVKRSGIVVIEIPDMGSALAVEQRESFKHVKPREHLWYFTATQLRNLLETLGFTVVGMEVPIPGKVTIYASPAAVVEEVTIYGPPGIGDVMWTLTKLGGIRDREAPCRVNYIVCADDIHGKIATRSKDFLLGCVYIDSCEFRPLPLPKDVGNTDPSQPIYELLANDHLEPNAKLLSDWRPELPTNWDIGIETPECALDQVRMRLGDISDNYVALYLSSHVWNRITTLPVWRPADWAYLCIKLVDSGIKPVLLGAGWDNDYAGDVLSEIIAYGREPNLCMNAIGRTPLSLAMAYMQLSKVTIGVCAGLPMIAAHLGWPTIMVWPERGVSHTGAQFGKEFQTNWVPPKVLASGSYLPLATGTFTVESLFEEITKRTSNENKTEHLGFSHRI